MDRQTPIEAKTLIAWLNKLIMLAQFNRRLPFHAVRLRDAPAEYQAFLTRVRASATANEQLTDASPENTSVVLARKQLLEAVAAVPALQDLFGADQDPFKDAPADHLELLAEVSDVTPVPQNVVNSRNGTLVAVITAIRGSQSGTLDPDPLIVHWLNKFLTLEEIQPAQGEKSATEMLYELAVSPHWYIVMASLRAGRDYARDEEPAAADTLKLWNEKIARKPLKEIFLDPGHLARAPKELIRLAWEHEDCFDEARARIPEDAREKNPDDQRKQVANSALLVLNEKFNPQVEEIKARLNVLATIATHFINVRKFAKLDGFVYRWPEIAQLGRANYTALKHVEELLLNRLSKPGDADLDAHEARELYALIEKNDSFKKFMRLRPHFGEIKETELLNYQPLAPVVVSANRPGSSKPQPGDSAQQQEAAPPKSQSPTKVLIVQNLSLERAQNVPPSQEAVTYDLNFSMLGKTTTGLVTFRVDKLLEKILSAMGVSSDSGLQDMLKEHFASDPNLAEDRIRRGSVELATNVLPFSVEPLAEVLATPPSLRLVINSTERDIHYLPWEWWPTSTSTLALSSSDHSVIRGFESSNPDLPGPILRPLRLMSIIPNPPAGRRFTSDITLKALDEVTSAFSAEYRALVRDEAIMEAIGRQLAHFKPHIVHLETYVNVAASESRDYGLSIFLSGTDHGTTYLDYFGAALKSAGVRLVVIGRNDVSRMYENACATAAFQLAKQGLSVLAPMRAIDDASATTFTAEFYRAFLQGNTLESSLYQARRNLASKGGDWTVFALFTDPDRIQYLELVREPA